MGIVFLLLIMAFFLRAYWKLSEPSGTNKRKRKRGNGIFLNNTTERSGGISERQMTDEYYFFYNDRD